MVRRCVIFLLVTKYEGGDLEMAIRKNNEIDEFCTRILASIRAQMQELQFYPLFAPLLLLPGTSLKDFAS